MPVDHEKAFQLYWKLDDWHWLREAPLTDHDGITGIFRRFATKLEEHYMTIEMLESGNRGLVRERDAAMNEVKELNIERDALRAALRQAHRDALDSSEERTTISYKETP
jgi:hypothetical protein